MAIWNEITPSLKAKGVRDLFGKCGSVSIPISHLSLGKLSQLSVSCE